VSAADVANSAALERIAKSEPILVDLLPAGDVIAQLGDTEMLHAGPPLGGWAEACGPLRGAIIGTLLHYGWAESVTEAEPIASSDKYRLRAAADYHALATYAGVITRQTMVFVVENRSAGVRAFAAINEGRGKALRYGCNDAATLSRLAWLEGEFAEILGKAIRDAGGINIFDLLAQALHMGDDGHSRHKAASALFANAVAPCVAESGFGSQANGRVLKFLTETDIFFLPLTMAAAKSTMISAEGIPECTIITAMAANGVRWGIQVSGRQGEWFTAPVPPIEGQYFQGFSSVDASPVIGDSEIAETSGLGAFAMAAAPALARYVGGSPELARKMSMQMYDITLAEHPSFTIPYLDYRGTPMGIDLRRVVETGVTPVFNTGIAHNTAGVGQIGAGYGRVPLSCCTAALEAVQSASSC